LEGIAFQIADLGDAMAADAKSKIARLRVDGGASANDTLMQMQADLLGVAVDRPTTVETTALGAAYLAGLAVGVFPDLDAVRRAYRVERTFEVELTIEERERRLCSWREAVGRARNQTVTR